MASLSLNAARKSSPSKAAVNKDYRSTSSTAQTIFAKISRTGNRRKVIRCVKGGSRQPFVCSSRERIHSWVEVIPLPLTPPVMT